MRRVQNTEKTIWKRRRKCFTEYESWTTMHIKRIIIQGFKTYKNTTIIEDISPGHNVVVGRNGSGKSNFFAAIRFVLSDQYTRMSKEERQGLIHEGSGTVLSAYVEIVFDNTDGRFPTGKPEVVIRRTIGLKKDDYSLDHKSSTRQDIMQLLESAGFSKSNPYYIVPQGRITSLTNAKDAERLNLLKEVAGAKVFENKLKESQKEMTKTKNQRDKIDEMLEFIQERLSDLDSEKDELQIFQDLEKDKKVYEFILYDRELNDITNSIENVDSEYQRAIDDSHRYVEDLEKRENLVIELNNSKTEISQELKLLNIDKSQHASTLNELSKQIVEKTAALNEVRESYEFSLQSEQGNNKALKKINQKIRECESELQSKAPAVEVLKSREAELKKRISLLKTRQNFLYSKQGRYSQFSSKAERNKWINSQIKEIEEQHDTLIKSQTIINDEIEQLHQDIQKVSTEAEKIQDELNGVSAQKEIAELEQRLHGLRKQQLDETDARKSLWREEERAKAVLSSLDEDVNAANRDVSHTMDRQQSNGLEAVKRIAQRLGLSGVYGPLGELINVNPKYKVAVEVVASNSLFHVVVDTDRTASTIMEELVRERAGRVTFMPLNRISAKDVAFPDSNDSVPLIKKIGYDTGIEAAVKQVFGKTIVVINLERGTQLAREFKLSAITLEGDKADKKGVLTGGYRDFKKTRLDAIKVKQTKVKEVREQEQKLFKIREALTEKDQLILTIHNEITKVSTQYEDLINSKKPLKAKLSNVLGEKFKLEANETFHGERIKKVHTELLSVEAKLAELNNELKSEFIEGLSNEEKQSLESITTEINSLNEELAEILDDLLIKESEMYNTQAELNNVLKPRLQEILKRQISKTEGDSDSKIQDLTEEIENLEEKRNAAEELLNETVKQITAKNKELKSIEQSLNKADEHQRKLLRTLDNFQRNSEKYLSKRSLLVKRRDETQKKIRELGALPEKAFEEDQEISSETLLKNLTKVTKNLEKFSNVNRKALEQYLNFTKQRDGLVERRKELDNSEESILELINVLESRKENAIQKTFQQVSTAFTEVFEKLVPKGIGRLIMQTKTSPSQSVQIDDDEDVDMGGGNDSELDNYVGVSIQVSFNSKSDEQQRIEQLSGGQKSLCAIALILAIQKSDPAPFYLFDEIDANLDTQYRTAVANLIHDLSEDAQFICTTFRPEMLQVANKFFGVMFKSKISTVSEIQKSDAMEFIEGQQQQQQQQRQ